MDELKLEGIDQDRLDYEVIAIEGDEKVEVMLRLKAPVTPGAETGPYQVQVVLDTSESMHPRKLFPALRGIDYLASHLREDDRVGIVTFGGEAQRALPAAEVEDGENVRETLRQVHPFGVPDPVAGLLMGLNELKRTASSGAGALFLVTDGAVLKADNSQAHQLAGLAKTAKEAGFPVTVITMDGQVNGYLSSIAHQGDGRLVGTTDGARVCEVMLEKIPGRRKERIRGVEVVVESDDSVGTIWPKGDDEIEPYGDGVICHVGDLRDGQVRDVLFELEVEGLKELDDDHIAALDIRWSDLELEKAFWASMPVQVNGYPGDPRPNVSELFNTDPEEGVLFEFPKVEVKLRYPGKSQGEGGDEKPSPPKSAQEQMREAREKRKQVERMAEGDLPDEMAARIAELAREQSSREVARLMDEIREQVPAQLLDELKAKVEEEFRDSDDDEGEAEPAA
ncbi:MAG: VWA domain-containing protein [Solirubrobacterales bacterium]